MSTKTPALADNRGEHATRTPALAGNRGEHLDKDPSRCRQPRRPCQQRPRPLPATTASMSTKTPAVADKPATLSTKTPAVADKRGDPVDEAPDRCRQPRRACRRSPSRCQQPQRARRQSPAPHPPQHHSMISPPFFTSSFVNRRDPSVIVFGTGSPFRIRSAVSTASRPPVGYWNVASRIPCST